MSASTNDDEWSDDSLIWTVYNAGNVTDKPFLKTFLSIDILTLGNSHLFWGFEEQGLKPKNYRRIFG